MTKQEQLSHSRESEEKNTFCTVMVCSMTHEPTCLVRIKTCLHHQVSHSKFDKCPCQGDWVGVDITQGVRRQVRRGQDHLFLKGLQKRGGKAAFLQLVDRQLRQVLMLVICQKNYQNDEYGDVL